MFSKVLVADDLGSISQGVQSVLKSLNISESIQVHYCDDAYLQIKKAVSEQKPYDLLITDLSFKADHRIQKLNSGDELARILSKEHKDLPIIVYSVEDRLQRVKKLLGYTSVLGFVNKGRNGIKELKEAILTVASNKTYISPALNQLLNTNRDLDFSDYDIQLLNGLASGLSQQQISTAFKEKDIIPSSLSTLEKRLNHLKLEFNANNTIHLISIVKDLGLI